MCCVEVNAVCTQLLAVPCYSVAARAYMCCVEVNAVCTQLLAVPCYSVAARAYMCCVEVNAVCTQLLAVPCYSVAARAYMCCVEVNAVCTQLLAVPCYSALNVVTRSKYGIVCFYVYTTHLVTPAFSATAIAAASAAVSTSGLRGRKEDVRNLNMSRGERTLEKKSTNIKSILPPRLFSQSST